MSAGVVAVSKAHALALKLLAVAQHPQDIWPKVVANARRLSRVRAYQRALAAGELVVEVGKPAREQFLTVATPVYRVKEDHLRAAIASVRAQTHTAWELILLDDACPDPHVPRVLAEEAREDQRIRLLRRPVNAGIAIASNEIIAAARGDFVAFLDHDDLLHPRALELVARLLATQPEADWVFSDEDKIDERGRHHQPCLKPGWSHHLLLTFNYVCHLRVVRRTLLERLGGHRIGFDGAQDYDLALRALAVGARFVHLPGVLYHWRTVATSMARVAAAKPAAHEHALRALCEHAAGWPRGGAVSAEVLLTPASFFHVRRQAPPDLRLALLVEAGTAGEPERMGGWAVETVAASGWRHDPAALVEVARRSPADIVLAPPPCGFRTDELGELLNLLMVPRTALAAGRWMRRRQILLSGWVATDDGSLCDPWTGMKGGWRGYLNLLLVPGPRLVPPPWGWAAWRAELIAGWQAARDLPVAWRVTAGLARLGREVVVTPRVSIPAGAGFPPPAAPIPAGLPVHWRSWLERFGLARRPGPRGTIAPEAS